MNKSINAQVQSLATTKNPTAIKTWWNNLSSAQKALAIAAIAGLSAGAITYFTVAGVAVTTADAVIGSICVGYIAGTTTYIIAEEVISSRSLCDNCEEAEYYDITA